MTSPTTFDDGGDDLLRSTGRFFGGIAMEIDPPDRQSQRIRANPAILHAQFWIRLARRPSAQAGAIMGQAVVHFEIIGSDPAKLRGYYGALFDWEFVTRDATTEKVSQPGLYGFVDGSTTGDANGINGGIGGGRGYERRVLFYVGVPSVEAALRKAESLGGKRLMGPEPESGEFAVGRFIDPEGNVVGVAGPPT